ncbi:hypothetical protein [Flavobacterium phycosphaerae]|uniref:hypothetical protein n=1 Tax=Flavobacterium phycosphaerae TaxID=2697515 RepID=UPI00138A4D4C|nr:hypothetical protein [Flavobacterium phycosphaerae]
MKTFYSLIKIRTNQLSDDTVTIGLLLYNEMDFNIAFSKNKVAVAKSLLKSNNKIVDTIVKEITSSIKNFSSNKTRYDNSLWHLENKFNAKYFDYLSKYSNGFLSFTAPKFIDTNNSTNSFNKMFTLFVDEKFGLETFNEEKKEIEHRFNERVQLNLIQKVVEKVHTNYSFDNHIVPTLFNPFNMDCIGKNGVLIGAKSLSFTNSKETLHKNINTFVSVIAHLSSKYNKDIKDNQFYLIADEPKYNSEEHKIWKQIHDADNIIKLINSDESEQVAELIIAKRATTFIE